MEKEDKLIIGLIIVCLITIVSNVFAWAYVDVAYFIESPFWNIPKIVGGALNVLFCLSILILILKYLK